MDELTELVASRAKEMGFDVEVVSAGELMMGRAGTEASRVFLHNLAANLQGAESDEERDETIDAFLRALVPGEQRTLVVLVKPAAWLEQAEGKFSPGQVKQIAGDLYGVLAWDRGTNVVASKMSPADLTDDPWGRAADGVLAESEPLEMSGGALKMFTCGGNYEASMLLVDGVWDFVAEHVDGDVIAAAPARDLLFATGANDAAGLSEMESTIRRVFDGEFSYLVSRAMLRRCEGGWTEERVVQ